MAIIIILWGESPRGPGIRFYSTATWPVWWKPSQLGGPLCPSPIRRWSVELVNCLQDRICFLAWVKLAFIL